MRVLLVLGSHLALGLLLHEAALLLLLSGSNNFSLEPCKGFLKIWIYWVCGQQVSEAGFSLCRSHWLFSDGLDLSTCFVILFFSKESTISLELEICLISLRSSGFSAAPSVDESYIINPLASQLFAWQVAYLGQQLCNFMLDLIWSTWVSTNQQCVFFTVFLISLLYILF